MPKIPLTEGYYQSRSLIAEAQKCMNLFPERNPQDAEAPMTLYPTPGLVILNGDAQSGGGTSLPGWRGAYVASNGNVYGVCGSTLYYITPQFTVVALGAINTIGSPVVMKDNGETLVIVDGSATGYQVTLATNAFSVITDTNFQGGVRVDYIDTFFVTNTPNSQQFQSSLSNAATWNSLYFANKTGEPDLLASLIAVHREIWLLGQTSTEVWYDAGGATFPFQILPGVFIQQGCLAPYSVSSYDLLVFWLGQNPQGHAMVMMGQTYQAKRISTHAIEKELASYITLTDCVGFVYQQEGHTFYVMQFPTAQKTWVYDIATQMWHQRSWLNTVTQATQMWRPSFVINAYGIALAGDWQNGNLYRVDLNVYNDFGGPIVRTKSFPHMVTDGNRVHYKFFSADMEGGGSNQTPSWITLRWSDDRGITFGNGVLQSLGDLGNYRTQVKWSRLGMARDRVFELSWSIDSKTALNGAYLEALPFAS